MKVICQLIATATCLIWPVATVAQTQIDNLRGGWQQVQSNAGRCPTCRISIMEMAEGFSVTANNGWSATLRQQPDRDGVTAIGQGRWVVQQGSIVESINLDCRFVLRGDRLYLTMTVSAAGKPRQIVKAVFERPAYGA